MSPSVSLPSDAAATELSDVRSWLAKYHPRQLGSLDKFELELRLGRLSTSSSAAAKGTDCDEDDDTNDVSRGGGRHMRGSSRRLVTSRTVELLRQLIGSTRWRTGAQLMVLLKGLGKELHSAGGFREPAIGNVVRRIMSCVREEVASQTALAEAEERAKTEKKEKLVPISERRTSTKFGSSDVGGAAGAGKRNLSLASMLWAHPQHVGSVQQMNKRGTSGDQRGPLRRMRSGSVGSDGGAPPLSSTTSTSLDSLPESFHVNRPDLRQAVMEAIQEVMSELEDVHKLINDQALSHIHSDEIILTYARSKTVELFLKAAATKKRKFQVIVCEGAPHFGGHAMAKSLAAAGIDTTVINDSATFALMARVNKVLLPAHAVLANGGLIASSGCHMVALAAKQNAVPVVCLTGMFKLCPQYPHEGQDTLNDLVSPSSVVDYAEMSDPLLSGVEYVNPVHDYIPPQLINLYVTNIGGFQPSYIYRLLAEYYHSDDWESFE